MPDNVKFHYLKAADFRECHIDGAIGGPTARGLWFGLYSERAPVPTEAVHEVKVDPDGTFTIGALIPAESKSKQGVIRTLEVGAHFDLDTARALRDWLSRHIAMVEGNGAA